MFKYRPGIRQAQLLIFQQSSLNYGISTPKTSIIRRQWLSRSPPKSLPTQRDQPHPNHLDDRRDESELTKSQYRRKFESRSIQLDKGPSDWELPQSYHERKHQSNPTQLDTGSGDWELSQAVKRFVQITEFKNSKERRQAERKKESSAKEEAPRKARQAWRELKVEEKSE
jgi:hypothetical protein